MRYNILINMSYKFAAGLLLVLLTSSAAAQNVTNIPASAQSTAYNQDNQGNIARSQYGLCWRTGYWTPTDSVTGCDGELAPPIASPIAPPLVSNPAALTSAQNTYATSGTVSCNFAITLSDDQTFRTGATNLNDAARNTLEREVVEKLKNCSQIDTITVTGHADRLGTPKHNQEISLKRAEAVSAFLKGKKVSALIHTVGAGSTEPLAHCPDNIATKKLSSCLSPDRRVVISVQGHEK